MGTAALVCPSSEARQSCQSEPANRDITESRIDHWVPALERSPVALASARDLLQMSPFSFADKIKTPILVIHREADNNPGTFPLQSERL